MTSWVDHFNTHIISSMNVTCFLWAENDDNHSSQIALTIAGNLYPNNCAYNSFLGAAEMSTLSLATM